MTLDIFGAKHSLQFLSPPLKILIVLGYGNTRDSAQPQNVISDDWETISQKLILWRYGLEGRGGIFELLWFWRGICGIIRQLSRRVRFRFVLHIFFSDGLYPYVFRSVLLFFFWNNLISVYNLIWLSSWVLRIVFHALAFILALRQVSFIQTSSVWLKLLQYVTYVTYNTARLVRERRFVKLSTIIMRIISKSFEVSARKVTQIT